MAEEKNQETAQKSPLSVLFQGLGRNLIFRGVLEMTVGLLLLLAPVRTVRILTYVIGVLLIVDGLALFLSMLRSKSKSQWVIVNAVALVLFGAVTILSPLLMEYLWVVVLGVWLIVSALSELLGGGWRRIWSILSCLLSIAVGAIFIALPFYSIGIIVLTTGWVLIVSGFLTLCAGIDLRVASKKI